MDIYNISTCVSVLKFQKIRPTKKFPQFLWKIMQKKFIFIHCGPLQILLHTPTYTAIPTYVIFTQTLQLFLKVIIYSTHKNFKNPHLGNIHTTTSHRDTKNIHTESYIHDQNTFFTFLRQKIKLHLTPHNLSKKNTIPTSIKNKVFSLVVCI